MQRVPQRVPLPPPRGGPIIPIGGGGQDNIDNLQLLRTHCSRVKRDWPQEYLNSSQGEMRRWWESNDGAGSFSKYG